MSLMAVALDVLGAFPNKSHRIVIEGKDLRGIGDGKHWQNLGISSGDQKRIEKYSRY